MKKWIAVMLMVVIVAAAPLTVTRAYAQMLPGIVIEPCYNGVYAMLPDLYVDADGMAELTIQIKGASADTEFHVTTYLEREINDGVWVRVENGQLHNTWTDTVTGVMHMITHTAYTGRDADCRAVISLQVTHAGVTESGTETIYAAFY